MKKHTSLFLVLPITFALLGVACGNSTPKSTTPVQTTSGTGQGNGQGRNNTGGTANGIVWQNNGNGWVASSTPPACPTPLFAKQPVDINKVTSILYPGQTRGGNYKPHGGFRFDTIHNNVVAVSLPIDAQLVRGARYLVGGEVQYTFDFIADCGYMIRFGHLRELTSAFQTIADTFPAAQENDSRTTNVQPAVRFSAGTSLATKVGTTKDGNTFFDFGVYNLLTKNTAANNATWAADPMHDSELAQHAICWFDSFGSTTAKLIRGLPAGDPTSGKTSDFCTP